MSPKSFALKWLPWIIIFGVFISFVVSGILSRTALRPNGTTYAEWETQFGKPDGKIARFAKDSATYYEVIGKLSNGFFDLPSGPPAYIFDAQGNLVDWTSDTGDNPSYLDRWRVREFQSALIDYTAFIRLIRYTPKS